MILVHEQKGGATNDGEKVQCSVSQVLAGQRGRMYHGGALWPLPEDAPGRSERAGTERSEADGDKYSRDAGNEA